ncbi:MAG: Ig-like domain-containing protein [Bacteroidales bacterium]
MTLRFFALILCLVAAGAPAYADVLIDMSSVSANGEGYTYETVYDPLTQSAGYVITIVKDGAYTIRGTAATKSVKVAAGVTADVYVRGLNASSLTSPVLELCSDVSGGASVNMTVEGTNRLTGAIVTGSRASLTMKGNGILHCENRATSGNYLQAIRNDGAFYVQGGTLMAISANASCIGGANGTVNITGGTVYAFSASGNYGIEGKNVQIVNGIVVANSIYGDGMNIYGAGTVVLSPSVNATGAGDAKVITNVSLSPSVAGNETYLNVIVRGSLTIPAASTLTIPQNVILQVSESYGNLTNNGTIENFGKIDSYVYGTQPRTGIQSEWLRYNSQDTAQIYTGSDIMPQVTVSYQGALVQDVHYTVTYRNNVDAGAAIVAVTGIGEYAGTVYVEFTIKPKTITASMIHIEPQGYTGREVQPPPVITYGDLTLTYSKDYIIERYLNNIAIGSTATVTVSGVGNYTGTASGTFTITPKPLTSAMIQVTPERFAYSGKEHRPDVVLKDDSTLVRGTHYTISGYSENINAGTASVTVTGLSGSSVYGGTATKNFIIEPVSVIGEWFFDINQDVFTFTGKEIQPSVALSDPSLTLNKDYIVRYTNNINTGSQAIVAVVGIGNYTDSVKTTFTIIPQELVAGMVANIADCAYAGGNPVEPDIVIKNSENMTLILNKDYTVTCSNNTNVNAVATAVITGMGNYSGTVSKSFNIVPQPVAGEWIGAIPDCFYTGDSIKPDLTVKADGVTLSLNRDYTVEYANNINVGSALARIYGTGNYGGVATASFTIKQEAIGRIRTIPNQVYCGGLEVMPSLIVEGSNSGQPLSASAYSAVYTNNKEIGIASVSVTGNDNCPGSASGSFIIAPRPADSLKIQPITPPTYTGKELQPPVVVYFTVASGAEEKVVTLNPNVDYSVAYSDNINAGTGRVTIDCRGNYTGTFTGLFTINRAQTTVTFPDTMNITYFPGVTLSAVSLPVNFEWETPDTALNVGFGQKFPAIYLDPNGNYEARGMVTVNVASTVQSLYVVSIGTTTNGEVSVSPATSVEAGATVTLTLTPSVGYELYAVTVDKTSETSETIPLSGQGNTRTFVMPAYGVTVSAVFNRIAQVRLIQIQAALSDAVKPYVAIEPAAGSVLAKFAGDVIQLAITVTSGVNLPVPEVYINGVKTEITKVNTTLYYSTIVVGQQDLIVEIRGFNGTGVAETAGGVLRTIPTSDGFTVTGLVAGEVFSVYNLQGQLVYQGRATASEEAVYLRNKGVYIVVAGAERVKAGY